jgi:hypothetical protein
MRKGMLSLALVLITFPTAADMPIERNPRDAVPTLLEKALNAPFAAQESRPTGQCIYACGDRQIILRRCPDGDCPESDCQTASATCRSR